MAKIKLSSGEKKLKALLSENGGLTVLQKEVQKIFEGQTTSDYEVFIPLEKLLVAVSKFQDKHYNTMNGLKTFFKGNESIMVHLGPLHSHIKTSGRDARKSEKHKSFVKNKAGIIKKNRLSRPKYETVDETKILLLNDYYDNPQPLSFVKSSRAVGFVNERMVEDLKERVHQFLEENHNKISCNISDLRDLLK